MQSHRQSTSLSSKSATTGASGQRTSRPASVSNAEMQERLAASQGNGLTDGFDGLPATSSQTDIGVENAATVEAASLDPSDARNTTFAHMNADWERGIQLPTVDGTTPGTTPVQNAGGGIATVDDYRAMLRQDFNFQGMVDDFAGEAADRSPEQVRAAGESRFLASVVKRFYPGRAVDDPTVQPAVAIARNLWSYATCGHDTAGVTDIAQMQGLLYVFDEQVAANSDTNTRMAKGDKEDDYFVVPGTESWDSPIKLLKGDGRHGRATILTTRHILQNSSGPAPDHSTTGYDQSFLLLDRSESMRVDEYGKLVQTLEAGGIDGEVALATFDSDGQNLLNTRGSLEKVQDGQPLDRDEAALLLERASRRHTGNVQAGDFLPGALASGSGQVSHEQGLGNALKWLDSPEVVADPKVQQQLIVVTDEPDFAPAYLERLQAKAREKGVSVKVLYSFSSSSPDVYGTGNADSYVVIDVLHIDRILDAWKTVRPEEARWGQLDWLEVAKAQGSVVKRWEDAAE